MPQSSMSSRLSRNAFAFVLAGGRGSRLCELTDRRAKPAVYFGGKSRIIDFALSNALNSGIRRISVATQYKAHSLIRHLQRGWNFMRPERNESFDILPASQRVSETMWYEGTADAVYQNIDIIESYAPEFIVILAGDHIYKMDYEIMLQQHVSEGADVTVGCIEVPRMEATGFGVMAIDGDRKITAFLEKPADPPAMPGHPDTALASMGIYVFDSKYLYQLLEEDGILENLLQPGGTLEQLVALGNTIENLIPTLERLVPIIGSLDETVPDLHEAVNVLNATVEPLSRVANRVPMGRRRAVLVASRADVGPEEPPVG